MKGTGFLGYALAALLIVFVGCGGGGAEPPDILNSPPAGTQMTFSANTTAIAPGGWIQFTVTANNPETVLQTVSLDFDGNGTWDDVQNYDQSSITEQVNHTYNSAGTFTVRAEVKDANNVPTVKTLVVTVTAPPTPPVSWSIGGGTSGGSSGYCYAVGPPFTGTGYITRINAEKTGSLGSPASGSTVTVTQAFSQDRYVTGTTFFYACHFHVYINATTPAGQTQIGSGNCSTYSDGTNQDSTRNCSVTVSAIVP